MANPCDRPGTWRATPTRWGIKGANDSQSLRVRMLFSLEEYWDEASEQWIDWRKYGMEVWGSIVIVKRDGTSHHQGIESLALAFGWTDGDPEFFNDDSKPLRSCNITTQLDKYAQGKGETAFELGWLNPYSDVPGKREMKLDAAQMQAARAKYITEFRAIASSAARNAPPPKLNEDGPEATAPTGDDIPF